MENIHSKSFVIENSGDSVNISKTTSVQLEPTCKALLVYSAILELDQSRKTYDILLDKTSYHERFVSRIFNTQHDTKLFRFVTTTIVKNIDKTNRASTRISVQDGDFVLHCRFHDNNIFVALTTTSYNAKVAHRYLQKLCLNQKSFPELFNEYQNQLNDPYFKLQMDINDTRDIIMEDIDKLFSRGETLQDLIDKSKQLSSQTKSFYKRSKKTSRWCPLLWF